MTAKTTTVDLVRHAESEMNLTPQLIGGRSLSTPLSPAGAAAARVRGAEFAREGILPDALYCTSAVRSRSTAEFLAEGAGWDLPIELEDGLVELSQGAAEGGDRAQWWNPQTVAEMRRDPLDHRLAPDGESHRDVQARMIDALERLHERHPGQHVVAVSHGVVMRSLLWRLNDADHDYFRATLIPNLGRLRLEVSDAGIESRPLMTIDELIAAEAKASEQDMDAELKPGTGVTRGHGRP